MANGVRLGCQDLGKSKVRNLCDGFCVVQQHIVGLAVKPDEAHLVQVHQAPHNAQGDVAPLVVPASGPRPGCVSFDVLAQVSALHELRDQEDLHRPRMAAPYFMSLHCELSAQ